MTKNLTEGEPARLILFFTLPLIAGNVWLFGHPCGQEMPISPVTKPVPLA